MMLKIFSCDQNSLRNHNPHLQDNNLHNMVGMDLKDKDKLMGDSTDTINGIYLTVVLMILSIALSMVLSIDDDSDGSSGP